jgi:hypothetical protein
LHQPSEFDADRGQIAADEVVQVPGDAPGLSEC